MAFELNFHEKLKQFKITLKKKLIVFKFVLLNFET